MENKFEVNEGDNVSVVIEVRKNDSTAFRNSYEGKVTEVVERAKDCSYVKIEGLNDRLIAIDKIVIGKLY